MVFLQLQDYWCPPTYWFLKLDKKVCSPILFHNLPEGGSFSYLCWVCPHCLVELMELRLALRPPEQKRLLSPCQRSAWWTPPRIESWSRSCPCPRSWCCPRCSSTPGCLGTCRPCRSRLSWWRRGNNFFITEMGIMVLLLETASLWTIYFDIVVRGKKWEVREDGGIG